VLGKKMKPTLWLALLEKALISDGIMRVRLLVKLRPVEMEGDIGEELISRELDGTSDPCGRSSRSKSKAADEGVRPAQTAGGNLGSTLN
jgi:hypothetical protein